MFRKVPPQSWKLVALVVLALLAIQVAARRSGQAQTLTQAKPQYKAEIVPSAAGAKGLEAVLNKYVAESYEIFDIDRAADGSALVVFQRTKK